MAHDAHQKPPEALRAIFKQWQKTSADAVTTGPDLLDTNNLEGDPHLTERQLSSARIASIKAACSSFLQRAQEQPATTKYFEVKSLPGLCIYPSLLQHPVQISLLDKLLHRDLSNPNHKTNVHFHHEFPTPPHPQPAEELESTLRSSSLFELDRQLILQPKDTKIHKPITMKQVLERKLRWVTLGGQYDWTNKVYPDELPPPFPCDIAQLLQGIFPDIVPQAAILNFYSPGDILSLHRDVSEECNQALISVSIGCDALFLIANHDSSHTATIRLRSGDAILMSGESRYAWHAVPKVMAGTCPTALRGWPATTSGSQYVAWKEWLANKRINLNVRQMRPEPFAYSAN